MYEMYPRDWGEKPDDRRSAIDGSTADRGETPRRRPRIPGTLEAIGKNALWHSGVPVDDSTSTDQAA